MSVSPPPSVPNHSHVCGINNDALRISFCASESFPRMWDQQIQHTGQPASARIIPTYVGSTETIKERRRHRSNHSHVCGINHLYRALHDETSESFPRMWDQLGLSQKDVAECRIIPTYVGSTRKGRARIAVYSNHSHVCGINLRRSGCRGCIDESFPRMWDQHVPNACEIRCERIIPTYVGSTTHDFLDTSSVPNHSHVCGINLKTRICPISKFESFPRMWDQRIRL